MYKLSNLFQIFLIFSTVILINSTFSEKRLCGNPKCSEIISTGKTTISYPSAEKHILAFKGNTAVRIFGKSLVSKLWEVEITGRRGYVPSNFIKEDRVFVKKADLIEVSGIGNNHNSLTNSEPEKAIAPKTDLKSSQINKLDIDEVSTTTTAPLISDVVKNQINTDKIDTNISTELPSSSPVQKNVNLVDGTPITVEDISSNESDNDGSDEDFDIADEDENEFRDKEYNEDIVNKSKLDKKLSDNNKLPNSRTIIPSKSSEFLNVATKTIGILNSNKVDDRMNENTYKNIKYGSLHQDQNTDDQIISERIDKKQDSIEARSDYSLIKPHDFPDNVLESENKTDKSAENMNDNSVQNLDITDTKIYNPENKIEVNENIPAPIKYYTVGDKKIENLQNYNAENIKTEKNNTFEKIRSIESIGSEKNEIEDVSNTANSGEIIQPAIKSEYPKAEANTNEPESKQYDVITYNLKENNELENKFPEVNILVESNKNEIESKQDNIITSKSEQNNNEKAINNGNNHTSENKIEEKLVEKKQSGIENITLDKNEEGLHTDNVASLKNDGENSVKSVQKNDTQSMENTVSSEEPSDSIQIIEEKPLQKPPDLHGSTDHGHNHLSHTLPPIFKSQPNLNHDFKPEESIDINQELTTPSNDDSPFLDPNFDVATINPNKHPGTENAPKNENKEESTSGLPLLPGIQNSDELEVKYIKPEDRPSENINKNEYITDHIVENSDEIEVKLIKPEQRSTENINKNEFIEDHPSHHMPNENEGLFAIILNTVNNFLSSSSSSPHLNKKNYEHDNELEKILYPSNEILHTNIEKSNDRNGIGDEGFCENIGPNSCPTTSTSELHFFTSMSDKILEMFDVLVCLGIAAASSILFAFGYYCICNCRKESSLISKLNVVERSLLASYKEVAIVKHDLLETRNKLSSIQDNSFGSNDMVIALKKDIVDREETNIKLQDQITNLEKELENAAEAGLELNKIVSDLLNSQNGDASIANSVEELQKQLNEQQKTIEEINTILGEKSRENSELNIFLSEQGINFQKEMQELQEKLDESENNTILLQSKFNEAQKEINENLSKDLNAKENTILSLKHELDLLQPKYDDLIKKCQASEARVEALEECIASTKKDSKVNMKEFMDVANLKADILSIKRERDSFKERLEGEMDARKLLEDHVKIISEEVSTLKLEYNQSEKDKLEAQTRLDVLSTYFREKETQLQKELSVKEAMWMKQQGETTSTVERVRTMQDEIQALKSQNDSLRAEIEAQSAAHKAQISSLENRAHETWLTSRQSERKFDEARSEAAALRRKLTALAGVPNERLQNSVTDGLTPNSLNNAPSPIHMDSPNSPPLLAGLPPPPPFLPPPFMAPPPLPPHPHHFMGMPPPFLPPREMRPPPLGRLMSPPPMQPATNHNRYSPSILDDEDDDYEYEHRHIRGNVGGGRYTPENGRRYSPDNGRNYSPDSRYNYTTDIMSTYDTETDFSPPPSPRGFRNVGGGGTNRYDNRSTPGERNSRIGNNGNGPYKAFSPPPQQNLNKSQQISNSDLRNKSKSNKGLLSSGSEKSFDSRKSKGKMKV